MASFSSNKPYLIRALYEWIMDNQGTPHLIANADFSGVQVPREHVQNGEIVLNISSSAVQGLSIENDEVVFNARFSGVARVIRLPMPSVLAIIARENGQGMAFPPEEMEELDVEPQLASQNSDNAEEVSKLSKKTNADQTENKSGKVSKNSKKSGKGSHLKVIK